MPVSPNSNLSNDGAVVTLKSVGSTKPSLTLIEIVFVGLFAPLL